MEKQVQKIDEDLIQKTIQQARQWQSRANQLLTNEERNNLKMIDRLLSHPMDKVTLLRILDESFRSSSRLKVAGRLHTLLKQYGIPQFLGSFDTSLMQLFMAAGHHAPDISIPALVRQIRKLSSRVVLPGENRLLKAHLARRRAEGVRMNINHIGEVVLGEEEARTRLDTYRKDLADPEIEYISVKISTIYSQISSLALEQTVEELKKRLSVLYRAAGQNRYLRPDGTAVKKIVNLDMEEYRDLELTARAFMAALDQEEFTSHSAGIVLQAYLPDSLAMQQRITQWAKKRVQRGGAPIRLRIVKGANLEMEQLEAALKNWPLATYTTKLEVDANYKRMVQYALQPENASAVHLGLASHNLFDLAFGLQVAKAGNTTKYFGFEMLEGMADHVRRAIGENGEDLLLYAPVAGKEQFINAIGYLVRRLDENTGPENFLRYANELEPGSTRWQYLEQGFLNSIALQDSTKKTPNRIQNRQAESWDNFKGGSYFLGRFVNEPDTDWALAANRQWAEAIRKQWLITTPEEIPDIPLVIAEEELFEGTKIRKGIDPSRAGEKSTTNCISFRSAQAGDRESEQALATAVADPDGWRKLSYRKRHQVLTRVAAEIRAARSDLIGASAACCGKLITEADVEVSEAVDFVEFYPHSARKLAELGSVSATGRGVGLVISPWNFPVAIPCGGITAALAGGNTVLFKPSSDAVLPAWILCNCFWRAGISKNTLQFLPCDGATTGQKLAANPKISFVILTGGTTTGLQLLASRPELALSAETGGKNATVVTAMADRDQAIKNVIHSAFSNSGQKCSATSLLILEEEVYEDDGFRQALVDAAGSLQAGSAWEYTTSMGPLIRPPTGKLLQALTTLEPGEEWALKPEQVGDNPCLWSPGIKYNVQAGSPTHMTEFFGPVLAVMRAENLEHAVQLVNQTGFGLTSGLESLDETEQEFWKETVRAGNLYINRGTTGAIVLRQPFGGMGKSAIGPGIKAGGPNYVSQFMQFTDNQTPTFFPPQQETRFFRSCQELENRLRWTTMAEYQPELTRFLQAAYSYAGWWEEEFAQATDYFHLRGQDNLCRYLPVGSVIVRATAHDSLWEVLSMCAAAIITKNSVTLSLPEDLDNQVTHFIQTAEGKRLLCEVQRVFEDDTTLAERIDTVDRVRFSDPDRVPELVYKKAAISGCCIARTPVLAEGRLELLQYVREQAICNNYHRYGNLKERGLL